MEEEEDSECCCCSKSVSDRCFVIAVVSMIIFCFLSYWYLIVIPWKWVTVPSLAGFFNVVALHFSFSLLCVSYFKTMWTCPGFPSKGWTPPGISPQGLETIKQLDSGYKSSKHIDVTQFLLPRWCKHCQNWKPPRARHCRELNVCVLKYDHYCPWVWNAIGYRNHKYFFLFLFYASACLTYFLICCITRLFYELAYRQRGRILFTIPEIVLFMLQVVLTFPVTIGIISLFFYQISVLTNNCTNVEWFWYKGYKRAAKKQGRNFVWFYDFGMMYNIRDMLGQSLKEWFIPTIPEHVKKGDGVDWKTRSVPEATPLESTDKNNLEQKKKE